MYFKRTGWEITINFVANNITFFGNPDIYNWWDAATKKAPAPTLRAI